MEVKETAGEVVKELYERFAVVTGGELALASRLQPIELTGPPDSETWSQSLRVWRIRWIMLDAVSSGTLDANHDMVRQHSMRCTASTWVFEYQADVRTRMEHLERTCRGAALLACGCRHWCPTVRRQAPLGLGIAGCHRGPRILGRGAQGASRACACPGQPDE